MTKSVLLALFVSSLMFSTTSASGQLQKKKTNVREKFRKKLKRINDLSREIGIKLRAAKKNGNLLTEMQTLRKLEEESRSKEPAALPMIRLFMMQTAAELGNYRDAHRYADRRQLRYPKLAESLKELKKYKQVDALEAIASLSNDSQVILINEAHHVPQHRAFTIRLLKILRKKGFAYFAAETIYASDAELNKRGYPTKASGAYIKEPLYGDLVRNAIRLGYEVIPYEWQRVEKYTPDRREIGQAKNLYERIFKKKPKAKVLVHAGYSHIYESGTLAGAKTMAQRLREMTGIDPLTIDQTQMTEHSKPEYEHPLYTAIMKKTDWRTPFFYRNADSKWWSLQKGKIDVTLVHPRSIYMHGRPDWLSLGGDRKPYVIPSNYRKNFKRCVVTARYANESKDAIPVDRLEVLSENSKPILFLPNGKFQMQISDAQGKNKVNWRIAVR